MSFERTCAPDAGSGGAGASQSTPLKASFSDRCGQPWPPALTAAGEGRFPYCGRFGKVVLLDLDR